MKMLVILLIFVVIFSFPTSADTYEFEQFESVTDISSELLVDAESLSIPDDVAKLLGIDRKLDTSSLMNIISENSISNIIEYLKNEILSPLKFFGIIICLVLILAIFSTTELFDAYKQQIELIFNAILIITISVPIIDLITRSAKSIESISVFMTSFIPIFMGVLIVGLKTTLASGISPSLFMISEFIMFISNKLIIPLSSASLAISISSGISGDKLKGATKGLKKVILFSLSFMMTVFLGILTIKTTVFSIADTTTLKTAKFLSGSFIPFVGSSVAEMLSGICYCVNTIKSTVGILGIIVTIVIILPSLLQIIAYKTCFSICSSVCELFNQNFATKLLSSLSDTLSILLSVLIICGIMCIFSITILILGVS